MFQCPVDAAAGRATERLRSSLSPFSPNPMPYDISSPNMDRPNHTRLAETEIDGSIVFIVDDDPSMRDALTRLFRSVGLQSKAFTSGAELLQADLSAASACLVLDVRLPGLSGLDLQAKLAESKIKLPVVFLTGHGDIPMVVMAMKAGAVDFLTKPFREQDLLDAVAIALDLDRKRRDHEAIVSTLQSLFASLTPREQQVMALVTEGFMSKHIAAEMGLSEMTVKVHRSRLMRKMGARSIVDLVRMSDALGFGNGPLPSRFRH